ncbi:protoglobin [Chitinophaga japonensis]|uniref:Protoglobin n=2 Tax=Chitinophaga japonensis TaxID=104662 RepID=A0A562TDY1_CHIJA|nr:protoglobin [Chitinophaga japonensis]
MINGKRYESTSAGMTSSTLSLRDLVLLKRMLLFTREDERYLQMAGEILSDQAEAILDIWYDHMVANDYLAHYFARDGQPDADYLNTLRPRFGNWIRQLCQRPYNTQWSQYEQAIAQRYQQQSLPTAEMADVPVVFLRYLVTFIYPVTNAIRPFLAKDGHRPEEVEKMHQAWFKAVSLSVILWTYPDPAAQEIC